MPDLPQLLAAIRADPGGEAGWLALSAWLWDIPAGSHVRLPLGRTRHAADRRPNRGLDWFGQRRPAFNDERQVEVI